MKLFDLFKKQKNTELTLSKQTTDMPEVVFVIDRSGSMLAIKEDAIGGFNSFLAEQQKNPDALFTLIQFDHEVEMVTNGANIADAIPYTNNTYLPRGTTSLFDAIGEGILTAAARGEKRKVIVAVLTDGHENSSVAFSHTEIREMISKYENLGWAFIFLAAGFDQASAENMSSQIGIKASRTMGFKKSDTLATYGCASNAATSYRNTGDIGVDWKKHD